MRNSYLFYDIETSGLNKCFDQVLQFAAIRTDLELQELERHEIFVKLNPDVIPTPAAILVHQLSIGKMQDGICEYEAVKKIHRLFNTPGTISVGYNSLGFDDEFLRFSFYRNLLAPYTHQYANNCSRMDIYPMAVMYYLFKPEGIVWPKFNGIVSLKLEHLNAQNQLTPGVAHNAMHDVEATLSLAQLLKKEASMWEYLCGYFDKKTDLERLEKLTFIADKYQQALLIDGSLGGAKFYQSPAIGLGLHNHYKNQSLWLSLERELTTTAFVSRKRFGESPILLPLTERFSRYLSEERRGLVTANVEWLQKNPELFLEACEYHKEYKYPEIPNLDIDAALYQNGFISDGERFKCDSFHMAPVREKISLLDQFSDLNLRTQAIRVLGRNYPELLSKEGHLYAEFLRYLEKIKLGEMIVNYKNEMRLTSPSALIEIENLSKTQNLSNSQQELLMGLARYIQSW